MNRFEDNPLWQYSLSVYSDPAVAATCLDLQNQCGLDVNLLLYAAWLAQRGERLVASHLKGADATVETWRSDTIRPLRRVRARVGALRCSDRHSIARFERAAEALYSELLALELRAERTEQYMLYAYRETAGKLPAENLPLWPNLLSVAELAGEGCAACEQLLGRLQADLESAAPG